MFGGWGELWDCVTYWFQPDWVSSMFGESDKNLRAGLRLVGFLVLCGVVVGLEHLLLAWWRAG